MKVSIKNVTLKKKININNVKLGIKRVYPELEDLEITPSGVEQNFKSQEYYGYDEVKVKAVVSDTLDVIPTTEEQEITGLYGIVNIKAVDSSIDKNIKAENIKQGVNILGVVGEAYDVDKIEKVINDSGVIDVEGSIEDKIDGLIDKADLLKKVNGISFYMNREITNIEVDCSNFTHAEGMFRGCNSLKTATLSNTQNIKYWGACFHSDAHIETIETLDFSNATTMNNTFYSCDRIKNIKFVANTILLSITLVSDNLTENSIKSIIDGLATVEKTQTLKLSTNIKAKLTDEQIASITSKNWTLA